MDLGDLSPIILLLVSAFTRWRNRCFPAGDLTLLGAPRIVNESRKLLLEPTCPPAKHGRATARVAVRNVSLSFRRLSGGPWRETWPEASTGRQGCPLVVSGTGLLQKIVIAALVGGYLARPHMKNLAGELTDEMHVVGNEH